MMCDSDDDALYFYRREKEAAAPMPPPIHMVTSAHSARVRWSADRALQGSTAPVAPRGCPNAMAPPLGFTHTLSSPSSQIHGMGLAYYGMGNKTGIWGDAAHRFDPTADDYILLSRQYGVGSGLWSGRRL